MATETAHLIPTALAQIAHTTISQRNSNARIQRCRLLMKQSAARCTKKRNRQVRLLDKLKDHLL